MGVLVVLLRGINVGKAKQVPMADLRTLLEEAGYDDVRTHLRSGNVVLRTGKAAAAAAKDIEARFEAHFGFDSRMVVRTGKQLLDVEAADPLADVADNPSRKLVAFLDGKPKAAAVKALLAEDFGPERLVAEGRELHLWCPDGQTNSPLADAVRKADLGVAATVRNWNTVVKLAALVRDAG